MRRLLKVAVLAGWLLFWLLPLVSDVVATSQVTVDLTTYGQGPFDARFYKKDGIVFTQGSFVGYIQGDEALVGPVAGRFGQPVSTLSARVAPALQGTAEYRLTAFDASGEAVASASAIVTQDMGDQATGPFGYFTIDLGDLPGQAKSFTLENRFLRSSFTNTSVPFGVSSISYTRQAGQ